MQRMGIVPAVAAVGLVLCVIAAPVAAAEGSEAFPSASQENASGAQDEVVCKRVKVKETGSRVSREKVCKTKAEWGDADASKSKEEESDD